MSGHTYATPAGDHAAFREAKVSPGYLPLDIVAFLQGGVAPIIGVRSADGRPLVGSAAACRVQDMRVVRIFLDRGRNAALLESIAGGSAVAATFSRAKDHRSIQLKAQSAVLRDPESADLPEITRQCTILRDELVDLGYTRPQATAYTHFDATTLGVVEFVPQRVFSQTPGPGAGAELRR
jgi:hypothetical protein